MVPVVIEGLLEQLVSDEQGQYREVGWQCSCHSVIKELYHGNDSTLEEEYRRLKLSPQEIYERRNDDTTTEIVESIRTRLYNFWQTGMK